MDGSTGEDFATYWTLKKEMDRHAASEDQEIIPMKIPEDILVTLLFDGPPSVDSRAVR